MKKSRGDIDKEIMPPLKQDDRMIAITEKQGAMETGLPDVLFLSKIKHLQKSKNFSWANFWFFINSSKKVINKKRLRIEDFHLLRFKVRLPGDGGVDMNGNFIQGNGTKWKKWK